MISSDLFVYLLFAPVQNYIVLIEQFKFFLVSLDFKYLIFNAKANQKLIFDPPYRSGNGPSNRVI